MKKIICVLLSVVMVISSLLLNVSAYDIAVTYPHDKELCRRYNDIDLEGPINDGDWFGFDLFVPLDYDGVKYSMCWDETGYYYAFKIDDTTVNAGEDRFVLSMSPLDERFEQQAGADSEHVASINIVRYENEYKAQILQPSGSKVNINSADKIKTGYYTNKDKTVDLKVYVPKEVFGIEKIPEPNSGNEFAYTFFYYEAETDTSSATKGNTDFSPDSYTGGIYIDKTAFNEKILLKKKIDKIKYLDKNNYAYDGFVKAYKEMKKAEVIYNNVNSKELELHNANENLQKCIDDLICFNIKEEQRPLNILFVGNSLTFTASVPYMFKKIAQEMGKQVNYNEYTVSGTTLKRSYDEIGSKEFYKGYDIVVLQEYGGGMSDSNEYMKFIENMTDEIKSAGAQPIFYMPAFGGDEDFLCTYYPPDEKYSCIQYSEKYNIPVSPSGYTYYDVNSKSEHRDLFLVSKDDGFHPTTIGGVLTGVTLYNTIFKEKPQNYIDFILDDIYSENPKTFTQFYDENNKLVRHDLTKDYTRQELNDKFNNVAEIIWDRVNSKSIYKVEQDFSEITSFEKNDSDIEYDLTDIAGKKTTDFIKTNKKLCLDMPINFKDYNIFREFKINNENRKNYYTAMYSDDGIYIALRTNDNSDNKHVDGINRLTRLYVSIGDTLNISLRVDKDKKPLEFNMFKVADDNWEVYESNRIYNGVDIKSSLNEYGTYDIQTLIPWSAFGLDKAPEADGDNQMEMSLNYADASVPDFPKLEQRLANANYSDENTTLSELNLTKYKFVKSDSIENTADNRELGKVLRKAMSIDIQYYIPESTSNFDTICSNAKAVYYNIASTQKEIDDALSVLNNAIDNIRANAVKTILPPEILKAQGYNADYYTEKTGDILKKSISGAQYILEDNLTTQGDVYYAADMIDYVINKLELNGNYNKRALTKLIETAQGIDKSLYEKGSYNSLISSADNALVVINNSNAENTEIINAVIDMNKKISELISLVDKSELEKLIKKIEKIDLTPYTSKSGDKLKKKIDEAKKVYENKNSTQNSVDSMIAMLQNLKENLVLISKAVPEIIADNIKSTVITEKGFDIYTSSRTGVMEPKLEFGGDVTCEYYMDYACEYPLDDQIHLKEKITKIYAKTMYRKYELRIIKDIAAPVFSDLDETKWYAKCINETKDLGIVNGVEDGGKMYIKPEDNATRIESFVFILRMLGIDSLQFYGEAQPFSDYNHVNRWAEIYIKAAYKLGIVKGTTAPGTDDILLNGDAAISRAEYFTMLSRVLAKILPKDDKYKQYDLSTVYKDAADIEKLGDWAVDAAKFLSYNKIVEGSNGYFLPNNNVKRAEILKTMAECVKLY